MEEAKALLILLFVTGGACAFGAWQNSVAAGLFCWFALALLSND